MQLDLLPLIVVCPAGRQAGALEQALGSAAATAHAEQCSFGL